MIGPNHPKLYSAFVAQCTYKCTTRRYQSAPTTINGKMLCQRFVRASTLKLFMASDSTIRKKTKN